MPRKSRIDTTGALHHIMVRGIERCNIFRNDADRDNFLERLGKVIRETKTVCYAWALIPNHFHLLLQTGSMPISTVMRRLLTGYALYYNRKHRRIGHLFQNRFKSILCQKDIYFLELVRYIHLNPIRARIVDNLDELDKYKYCGHSVIVGRKDTEWQDIEKVLGMFGERMVSARRSYRAFIEKAINEGKRQDLTGGGLIRSAGGWEGVKALRKDQVYQRNDERILGDGNFVGQVLASAEEAMERRYALRSKGIDLDRLTNKVSEIFGVKAEEIWLPGRFRKIVEARSVLCYWAVREMGVSMTMLSRKMGISVAAISGSVIRGQKIVEEKGL
ncbi:MAG: transposase, partial [Deltaproteobacteria bacterium]|nr:transposase [Deltaproteobacteria bacterium]